MRFAPLVTALALAGGLVGFSTLSGQPPVGKAIKADPDLAALQGDWVVTKLDIPGEEAVPADLLKKFGVSIRGDLLTVRPPAEDKTSEPPIYFRLVLDSGKTPRHADALAVDAKGQPKRRISYSTNRGGKAIDRGPTPPAKAIYKLDADTLVVCAPLGEDDARPTAFKAVSPRNPKSFRADDQGYAVIHLSKKK